MVRVKQILKPPPAVKKEEPVVDTKGAKGAKKPTPAAAAAAVKEAAATVVAPPTTVDTDVHGESFGDNSSHEKREEQVELLRDRKILDLESTWTRARKNQYDAVTKRYACSLLCLLSYSMS